MHRLLTQHAKLKITPFYEKLEELIVSKHHYITAEHGMGAQYTDILGKLPDVCPSVIDLTTDWIQIGRESDLSTMEKRQLLDTLLLYRPWRKGPFSIFGIELDCEWRSYLKWNRLKDHISPLTHRRILDIGCSNGYYMFRMAAANPQMILGIEPFALFYYQFRLLQHFIQAPQIFCLPAKLEEMPVMRNYFDTIFCMGVLYHNRSPLDALKAMHTLLGTNGELVLETLTIEGAADVALCPQHRYAKMNNVFFLPTLSCLSNWLQRSGFTDIRHINTTCTTQNEQRRTHWIQTESLKDFLDPDDAGRTVEGYPAPRRSIVIATAK